jgi:hypothetical protein
VKLPLGDRPYYNTDNIANGIATDDMFDCYLEPVPGEGFITRRRPGLTEFTNLGTGLPGDGIYDWEAADKVIAVSGGRVFVITESGTITELDGFGEDESPLYSGSNHENWNLGIGWQNPITNESTQKPPIKYSTLKSVYNETTEETTYPFETGALAKVSDGTGDVTTVVTNTTLAGLYYEVVITPHVTVGSASYTLGGTTGSTITGTDTITDSILTISTQGLVITPTNTSRMVLKFAWKVKVAPRDYPISGTPVIFDDGQDTAGNPWLYMANGKLTYLKVTNG